MGKAHQSRQPACSGKYNPRRAPPNVATVLPRLETAGCIAYNAINDCKQVKPMASITIRNLDEQTKARLRVRAAHRKRSMEDEVRHILRAALADDATASSDLAQAIRRRFEPLGGVELALPGREPMRDPPKPNRK
jgi:plasmid stability protein